MGLVPDPLAHHLERVADNYESIGVEILNKLLESTQLSKGDNDVENLLFLAGISASTPYDRYSPLELLHNLPGNHLPLRRYNVHGFSLAEACYHKIDHGGADIHENQGVKGHIQAKKDCRCKKYEGIEG